MTNRNSISILFDVVDINQLDNKNKRFTTFPFYSKYKLSLQLEALSNMNKLLIKFTTYNLKMKDMVN